MDNDDDDIEEMLDFHNPEMAEEFKCCICMNVAYPHRQCKACTQSICLDCATQYVEDKIHATGTMPCPSCKTKIKGFTRNNAIGKMISRLRLTCKICNTKELMFGDFKQHLKNSCRTAGKLQKRPRSDEEEEDAHVSSKRQRVDDDDEASDDDEDEDEELEEDQEPDQILILRESSSGALEGLSSPPSTGSSTPPKDTAAANRLVSKLAKPKEVMSTNGFVSSVLDDSRDTQSSLESSIYYAMLAGRAGV